MRLAILSDTHSYIDNQIIKHCSEADLIIHAGDVGDPSVLEELQALAKPVRGAYGNIDGPEIRQQLPETDLFELAGVTIMVQHITGYPGRYLPAARERIAKLKPAVVICGHSHILKVMPGDSPKHLHINPGSCGKQGFHQVRTMIMLSIENKKPVNLQVIELGKRV